MGRRQSADRPGIIEQYPAHCHVNVQPGLQRGGIGSLLLNAFLDQLKLRRVPGIHVSTMSEQGKAFFGKAGMQMLARYPGPKISGHAASEVWFMGMKLGAP
jgi:GNAT superfamily N-acetyltransferase